MRRGREAKRKREREWKLEGERERPLFTSPPIPPAPPYSHQIQCSESPSICLSFLLSSRHSQYLFVFISSFHWILSTKNRIDHATKRFTLPDTSHINTHNAHVPPIFVIQVSQSSISLWNYRMMESLKIFEFLVISFFFICSITFFISFLWCLFLWDFQFKSSSLFQWQK